MIKGRCTKCGRYAIIPKGREVCWECYIVECQEFRPECKGGEE